jgi:hypothetical protein
MTDAEIDEAFNRASTSFILVQRGFYFALALAVNIIVTALLLLELYRFCRAA